jgi:mannose-6-phosphate isomerase-like protein (cupin superfamily)
MPMPYAADLADQYRIETRSERMPNGEIRFRMYGPDGNGYVRVVSGPSGAWQNSHSHHRIRETYVVETGWMVLAQYRPGLNEVELTRVDPGGIVTTEPLRKHNVYLPAHALIHVVKHGSVPGDADWLAAPDLDAVTKCLSEEQLLERAKTNP